MDEAVVQAAAMANPEVDATDPVVVAIAWALTFLVGKAVKDKERFDRIRHVLPLIALVSAVAARAVIETMQGHELTPETAFRALAAGAVAVMSHAQVREFMKAGKKAEPEES
jgi:hypothetical protein